jgi:hypothetical protein
VIGAAGDTEAGHMAGDPLAQRREALACRILQRRRGARGITEDAAMGVGDRGTGKERGIGDAARERDDVGLIDKLQQLADLGRRHAARPRRVMPVPGHHAARPESDKSILLT